jgi:predicted kinase
MHMSTLYLTYVPTHSGKTTFGKELYSRLVKQSKTILVDNDKVEEFIKDNFNNLRTDQDIVSTRTPENPDLRLRIPQLIVDYALTEKYNVIVTASHSKEVIRRKYYDIAKKHNSRLILLIFKTSRDEILSRIKTSERRTDLMLDAESFHDLAEKQKVTLQEPTEQEKSVSDNYYEIDENNSEDMLDLIVEENLNH